MLLNNHKSAYKPVTTQVTKLDWTLQREYMLWKGLSWSRQKQAVRLQRTIQQHGTVTTSNTNFHVFSL